MSDRSGDKLLKQVHRLYQKPNFSVKEIRSRRDGLEGYKDLDRHYRMNLDRESR